MAQTKDAKKKRNEQITEVFMAQIIGYIIAFALGAFFGLVITCCFVAASQEDERLEKLNKHSPDSE